MLRTIFSNNAKGLLRNRKINYQQITSVKTIPSNRIDANFKRFFSTSSIPSQSSQSSTSTPTHFDPSGAYDSTGRIPTAPYDPSPLPGTAPYYKSHLIITPSNSQRPEWTWPSHLESVSPFLSELSSRTKNGASLQGYGIAFSQGFEDVSRGDRDGEENKVDRFKQWDHRTSKFMRPIPNDPSEDETFRIDVFNSEGKHGVVPSISLKTLDSDQPFSKKLLDSISNSNTKKEDDEVHIYVCIHGTRDCRCGLVGPQVLESLKEEVSKHQESMLLKGKISKKVRLAGISHVGGHKWAVNALVYPHGDWYGNLRTSDAPLLLRAALAPSTSHHDLQDLRERLVHWTRWRGRLGLESLDARQHYDHWGPPLISSANLIPKPRPTTSSSSSTSSSPPPISTSTHIQPSSSPTDEVPLKFRSFEGKEYNLSGKIGESLKDIAKKYDLPSIEATCGGQLECATCHSWLIDDKDQLPGKEVLPGKTEEENDMLDYAIDRKESSRLICQVKVTKKLSDWMKDGGGRCQLPRF